MSKDPALILFKQTLFQLDQEYVLYSSLPAAKVHCKFVGLFESSEVIWDAQIRALKHEAYSPKDNHLGHNEPYIEVVLAQNTSSQHLDHKLFVGLPINLITTSVVRKTRIMIINYKRLRRGRHHFGKVS